MKLRERHLQATEILWKAYKVLIGVSSRNRQAKLYHDIARDTNELRIRLIRMGVPK